MLARFLFESMKNLMYMHMHFTFNLLHIITVSFSIKIMFLEKQNPLHTCILWWSFRNTWPGKCIYDIITRAFKLKLLPVSADVELWTVLWVYPKIRAHFVYGWRLHTKTHWKADSRQYNELHGVHNCFFLVWFLISIHLTLTVMALDNVYIQPFIPRFSTFRVVGKHLNQFLNRELDGREAFRTWRNAWVTFENSIHWYEWFLCVRDTTPGNPLLDNEEF